MSSVKIKIPPMGFTPIDNAFIDKYLSKARGDFIKVYIYCLRVGMENRDITIEEIASALCLLETDVIKALEYWEEEKIIHLSPEGLIEIFSVNSFESQNFNLLFNKQIKEMFDDIEKLIGRPLSSKEVSVYMNIIEDFKFSPEMVTLLVEYCSSKNKTDIRYIEKVALAWHDSGVKSYEDAQNHITKHEEKWVKYRTILNYLGIKDTDISKPQEEILEKWLFKYNFSLDIIFEAARICIMRINEANFSYIDAILTDWYKSGFKSIDDIKKHNKKNKNTKRNNSNPFANYGGQRQYDINELKKQLLGRGDRDE
ncbi:DnaD/phage-associated family protein [Fonticella tunisiensis]|uniref:DnaD/phage-associated family protein n=2 Tax=Fonticella tunisiensis TaxID=1096341 RepID=A0A4R7KT44_9CLOT|nr:DnaD/phage-associated family protein [Fonticella tunisiensis]